MNKFKVLLKPIAKHNPAKNNVFPIAINDASNNSTIPSTTNTNPKHIKPIPIF